MLTPEQIDALRDIASLIIAPVVDFLMEDIAKRISEAGQLTSTASYQIWIARQQGVSQKELKKKLRKLLNKSAAEIEDLLIQAAKVGYDFNLSKFPAAEAIPFTQNASLQQIVRAAVAVTKGELRNFTRTAGFVCPDGKARNLTDAYKNACDFAFSKVITGAQDYQSAIRAATKGLAEKGILQIDYESGKHNTVEVAVRRSVFGGISLCAEEVNRQNFELLGCDGYEISAHAASAPDHAPYQGRQFSKAAFEKLQAMLVRPIGALQFGCGHEASGIILGINEPQYTDEELEELQRQNEEGVTVDGRHYTLYEATQRQRKIERSIRSRKRRILIDEQLGDKDKLQTDQIRLQLLKQEYTRFSRASGLPMQHERMEVAGFTWKKGKAAEETVVRVEREKAAKKARLAARAAGKGSAAKTPATSTPADNQILGDRSYVDITGAWYPDAKPNSHPVVDLQEYVVDGVTYKVDGRNVQLDYKPYEKEIAELLAREVGGEIFMVPRVNNPQGVKTPDFLFHGKGYDLKTIGKTTGKNPIYNRIKNAKKQASNFVLDLTDSTLSEDVIEEQIKKIYQDHQTKSVDEIIIIRDGKIEKVYKRA